MGWIKGEIGRAVGLPRIIGGIPLDEIGATGFGLAIAAEAAQDIGRPKLKGARVAVQGFGAVGQHAARFLGERGAILVAASDSHGAVAIADGLDTAALIALKRAGQPVAAYPRGRKLESDGIIAVACDIWIPAARPDVLDSGNVEHLDTKLVLQGANIPATSEAEERLHARGILSIPDFIANAGGVICASVEYHGGTEALAFQTIAEKITANTREVLRGARDRNLLPREAGRQMAEGRVGAAMALRRWR